MQILSRPPTLPRGAARPPCGRQARPDARSTAWSSSNVTPGAAHIATGRSSAGACASRSAATIGSASRRASAATSRPASKIAFIPPCARNSTSRGAAARRTAERFEPIVVVIDDPRRGRERIVGRLEPPQSRHGDLRDVDFTLRELRS